MGKLYLGGLPTGPDVQLLREAFPVIRDGDELTHEQVESALRIARTTTRYRSVTTAWRVALFRDANLELAAIPGIGFRCLTQPERVDHNVSGFQRGTRKQGRSLRRLAMVHRDKLDQVSSTKLDHAVRLGAAIFQQGAQLMRELAPPKPAPQMSQLRLGDAKEHGRKP